MNNIVPTAKRIILWAIAFYLVMALLRGLMGDEIRWIELIFQSLVTSFIAYGLERFWKYKNSKQKQKDKTI